MFESNELKDRMFEAMQNKHMKQSELAAITGINKVQISCYLSGRYKPNSTNLLLIAKALGVSEAYLIGRVNPTKPALAEFIIKYRKEHKLSQRQFAEKSKLSNSYISLLEKNINPKTGERIKPSIDVYKAIADAMNIEVQELFSSISDSPINPYDSMCNSSRKKDEDYISLFLSLTDDQQKLIISQIKGILANKD